MTPLPFILWSLMMTVRPLVLRVEKQDESRVTGVLRVVSLHKVNSTGVQRSRRSLSIWQAGDDRDTTVKLRDVNLRTHFPSPDRRGVVERNLVSPR